MESFKSTCNSTYATLFREYQMFKNFDSGIKCQESFVCMWNEKKSQFNNKSELEKWAQDKILEYKKKNCLKNSSSILKFFPHSVDVII